MNEQMHEELLETYSKFEQMIHRYYAWKRRERGPHGNPHRGQGRILSLLKLQPEITQKELTYLLDMRPQSLGELLTKMEKKEFITREPATEDRRMMVIKLTEQGRAEVENLATAEEKSVFDALTEEEQQQLAALLEKVTQTMEAEMPEASAHTKGNSFASMGGFNNKRPHGHKPHHRHHHHADFADFFANFQ